MSHDKASDSAPGGISSRLALRNWRVSTRLYAILLIPVIVGLAFGGFRVQASIDTWREAQDAERTAELVRAAAAYGHALLDERDTTAEPLLAGDPDAPAIARAREATDKARAEFNAQVENMPETPGLKRRINSFRKAEPQLTSLRQDAYTEGNGTVETEEAYVNIQHPLMEFSNELGLGTGNVTSYGRTVYAISLTKASQSLQRAIGMRLLVKPADGEQARRQQLTAFASYAYLEGIAFEEFESSATPDEVERLNAALAAAEAESRKEAKTAGEEAREAGQQFIVPPTLDEMARLIGSGTSPESLAQQGVTPDAWFAASSRKFDAYRTVEEEMVETAVASTRQVADTARKDAVFNAVVVIAALIVAFIVAGMMARTMSRSMLRLRGAAFDVAEQRLPALVDQLSRTDPGKVDTRVEPIPIDSRDEIGEVARAFDQVHREAVRLAAEQALLRGNVNAIFTNLSQRNQGLIERQLELITDLEDHEAEPDQLESLFRLDHLATRMRRNGENLLILAGEEPGRRWNQPIPLVDVLRAATSEVEQYERIEISGVPESEIRGNAVTDLVHLLAELLENATSYSSPQSKVRVTATRLPDGRIMIEIHDKGIGLTPEDFADINRKLADPPTIDAAISRRMGLYVVGRLAGRHGIRVQLRPSSEQSGTTSLVMLPDSISLGSPTEEPMEEDFTVSRIVPEQPSAMQFGSGGARSAADLGFDDSRYQIPDDISTLDPVGRSLAREERRAALEAQQPQHQQHQQQQQPQQPPDQHQPQQQPFEGPPNDSAWPSEPGQQPHQAPQPYPQQAQQPDYDAPQAGYGSQPEDLFAPPPQAAQEPRYPTYGTPQPQESPYGAPQQGGYQMPYDPGFPTEAESYGPGAPPEGADSVGFDRPGPAQGNYHSVTDAGLPRRERQWDQPQPAAAAEQQPPSDTSAQPQAMRQQDDSEWRALNDQRWQRAGQLRAPQAGGVTESGLPRRVPRANLVEGAAAHNSQGGPQVSRAPEDVRGRLSSLHRGVRRGRDAGRDGSRTESQGYGPRSTYDQER